MATNVDKLQTEFPDMSQSTLTDVLNTYKNDRVAASKALRGISDELKMENENKVNELKEMFPSLPLEVIAAELEACKGNVDASIAPLFVKVEELSRYEKQKQNSNQKKKQQEEELRRRREEAKKQANQLMEIFKTIPKEKVQEVLDHNEGDIEATTMSLLKIVASQEEEAKKVAKAKVAENDKKKKLEQEQRMKELKFQALRDKFEDLTDDQVTTTLTSNDWDIKKALADLYVISFSKKKKEIKDLFQSMTEEDIEIALEENNQDKVRAVKALTVQREKKRLENQAKSMKDAAKKNKKKNLKAKKRASKQLKEELKQNEPEPTKEEPIEEESDDEPVPEPTPAPVVTPGVVISKVKQNALEQSLLVGEKMEKEIAASHMHIIKEEETLQHKATQELFRENLENIIEKQARGDSLPGMIPPPLPKQIDAILNKNKPVVEIEQVNVSITEKELPAQSNQPTSSTIPETKALVSLTVSNKVVDIGNPIVVTWEITSGVSSAWDWIGLFPVNKTNKQYVTYQWSGKQLTKGSLNFNAPNEYGEYEFRFFPNGYYEHATRSEPFKVGPQIELTGTVDRNANKIIAKWSQISGNLYSKCWIGLYEKSEMSNSNYITWDSAGKTGSEITFDLPFKPKEYELRFFTNSYVDVARSQPIRIEGQDTMSAKYENGMITVKLDVVTIDPYNESGWLGVYFVNEKDNRQWRRYKYFSSRIGDCQFKAPRTPGEYQVRMFANKTYDMILQSNTFTIPAPAEKQ